MTGGFFPAAVVKYAQQAQKITGCLASVTLAQWAQESGYGRFQLNANNPFGIKWHSSSGYPSVTKLTKEYVNGRWINVETQFVRFPTLLAAFIFHGRLITSLSGPYSSCASRKNIAVDFLRCIGPIYATDPKYADELIDIVQRNKLTQYD